MIKKKNKRGPSPKHSTLRILCGQAAGMCEFEGCNERLFYDNVTDKIFNSEYIAHIVASDPDGPRGDIVKSFQLSDKLENIMLMCAKHHRLIDDPIIGVSNYPVELLKEMKQCHEEKIAQVCSFLNVPKTEIVNFTSSIHGNLVNIDYKSTVQAVLPKKQPRNQYGTIMKIHPSNIEADHSSWEDLENELIFNYNHKILPLVERFMDIHFRYLLLLLSLLL